MRKRSPINSSRSPQAEWEDFDGAMVQEGSYRIKVRTTTQPPLISTLRVGSNCAISGAS